MSGSRSRRRLSRHADFIKDRLRYKTYLLTGVVPKAAPDAAGRRPSSTSSTKRRRDVLAPAHAPAMVRGVATSCDGAASRRPATSRDGLRWCAIVRDRAATPRISRDMPRYAAICRDGAMCCDGWIQRYFAISCDTVGLPNCVRRPAMDPYVRIDSTQLRRPGVFRGCPQ